MEHLSEMQSTLKLVDKRWYQSKKFIAFVFMEWLLFALALYILFVTRTLDWAHASVLVVVVFSMASLSLAFNSTQAKLDTYVRGVAMLGKDVRIGSKKED